MIAALRPWLDYQPGGRAPLGQCGQLPPGSEDSVLVRCMGVSLLERTLNIAYASRFEKNIEKLSNFGKYADLEIVAFELELVAFKRCAGNLKLNSAKLIERVGNLAL